MPGRFKAIHYYNAGAIFDTMMALFRPVMSKKIQDRVRHFCNKSNMLAFSVTRQNEVCLYQLFSRLVKEIVGLKLVCLLTITVSVGIKSGPQNKLL